MLKAMAILANKTSRNCTELCTGIKTLGKQNKQKLHRAMHRGKKSISSATQYDRTVAGDGKNFSSKRGDVQSSNRKSRDEHGLPKNVKSVNTEEPVTDGESKGKEGSEKKRDSNSCTSKKKDKCDNSKSTRDCSKHEMSGGHKKMKLNMLRGPRKSIECNRNQKKLDSTSSAEGSLKTREVNDGSDRIPVELIRKKERTM
jgi:senataxin